MQGGGKVDKGIEREKEGKAKETQRGGRGGEKRGEK